MHPDSDIAARSTVYVRPESAPPKKEKVDVEASEKDAPAAATGVAAKVAPASDSEDMAMSGGATSSAQPAVEEAKLQRPRIGSVHL